MKRARRRPATEKHSLNTRAGAIHEAAHVIAAFHWDASIGNLGVSISREPDGGNVSGLSYILWTQIAPSESERIQYASWVCALVAPFAEWTYWKKCGDAVDTLKLISSCRADFAVMSVADASIDILEDYGRVCFLLWGGKKVENWADAEMDAMTRDLVRDADAMLRAYWGQIEIFADALLGANGLHLSSADVDRWRDANFKRCDVALSTRAGA